jgi:hypothetical protein
MKWILGVIGLMALGAGAVRAVMSSDQMAAVVLVVVGALLVLSLDPPVYF